MGKLVRETWASLHPVCHCDNCPWVYTGANWRPLVRGHLSLNPTHRVYTSQSNRATYVWG